MKALLLSNSTNYGDTYLHHAKSYLAQFLGDRKQLLFVPYAGVTISYDEYTAKVQEALGGFGIEVRGIHTYSSPIDAVNQADAIAVGGGNTFRLLQQLYQEDLVELIRDHVNQGCYYIGWSAGSNVAGPTICTTNDMPIVEPRSFKSFDLVPFQINPHYTEKGVPNHGGETRRARIEEYIRLNDRDVVCLPEGSWLEINGESISYSGNESMKVYRKPDQVLDFEPDATGTYFQDLKKFTSS